MFWCSSSFISVLAICPPKCWRLPFSLSTSLRPRHVYPISAYWQFLLWMSHTETWDSLYQQPSSTFLLLYTLLPLPDCKAQLMVPLSKRGESWINARAQVPFLQLPISQIHPHLSFSGFFPSIPRLLKTFTIDSLPLVKNSSIQLLPEWFT